MGFFKKKNNDYDIEIKLKRHKDKNKSHYHVLFDEFMDKKDKQKYHTSIGLTTKKEKGKGNKNKKLKHSPFDDNKISYARRQGTVDKVKNYYSKIYKGNMDINDYNDLNSFAKKARKKHNNKK